MRDESSLRSELSKIRQLDKDLSKFESELEDMANEVASARDKMDDALKNNIDSYKKQFDDIKKDLISKADKSIAEAKAQFVVDVEKSGRVAFDLIADKTKIKENQIDRIIAQFGEWK